MPRKAIEKLPKHPCDGPGTDDWGNPNPAVRCDGQVNPRRPSKTGRHYCQKPACQAERVRLYQREKGGASKRQFRLWELAFVHDAVIKTRIVCPECHLVNALPGWPHRAPDSSPCKALVSAVDGRGVMADIIDAVWPEPRYKEPRSEESRNFFETPGA